MRHLQILTASSKTQLRLGSGNPKALVFSILILSAKFKFKSQGECQCNDVLCDSRLFDLPPLKLALLR